MHFSSEVHNLGTEKSVSQLVILRGSVFSISMDRSWYPAAPVPCSYFVLIPNCRNMRIFPRKPRSYNIDWLSGWTSPTASLPVI